MSKDAVVDNTAISKKKKSKALSQDTVDDGIVETTKREKKKRKRERKAEETDETSNQPSTDGAVDENHQRKKRRKKDEEKGEGKKKKRKGTREELVPSVDVENVPEPSTLETSSDGMAVGEVKKEKKSKKDKKRKRERSTIESEVKPSIEESEDAGQDAALNDVASDDSAHLDEKRKKSKKSKKSHAGESTATSTSTSSPAIPQPSSNALSEAEVTSYLRKHTIAIHSSETRVIPIVKFSDLPIPAELLSAFSTFKEPTPIQACTWPAAFLGKDVVGIAETGSGKTLAFGIPALSRLLSSPPTVPGVTTLVVAPTRELAVQTHDTLSALGEQFGIKSVAVFGGVPKEGQIQLLKAKQGKKSKTTTRIVVGTPGRILDLVQDGACDLSGVDYLVLDEADRMLDKGFENDIRRIIGFTKQGSDRQTMMFSATWPEAVRRLASTFQQDPIRVTVGSDDLTANTRVEQVVEVFDDARSKDTRLFNHLRALSSKGKSSGNKPRILVFALYKKEASRVEQTLRQKGYSVGALHGDMSQNSRLEALENFKNGTTQLLVATDVAARGLDIPDVEAVINYTFPLTIEDYIHRIGRTGRGGKSGKSITFFTGDQHEKALAGELARVLRDAGFEQECEALREKFPMTIKKKTHSVYGAFFREDIPMPKGPTKIVFE